MDHLFRDLHRQRPHSSVKSSGRDRSGGLSTHGLDACEDGTESERREDVQVVALSGFVHFRVELDLVKGRSTREEDGSVGRLDRLFESALCLTDRVRQSEHDRSLVVLGHVRQDFVGEAASDGRKTEESRRFDVLEAIERALFNVPLLKIGY